MSLIAFGISHKTASVELRERISVVADELGDALHSAAHFCQTNELMILSTCNRTEIFAYDCTAEKLLTWLCQFKNITQSIIVEHLYHYQGSEAIQHAIRVASGLDSMIMGEPQVLGQIKQARADAQMHGFLGKQLGWLTDQIIAGAKQVRTHTQIGEQAVSLGFATARLAEEIFTDPGAQCLLLVGVGEMNRLVAQHLLRLGVQKIILCNRTLDNAHVLAKQLAAGTDLQIQVVGLDRLADILVDGDIVCSCTASLKPLITRQMVKSAIKKRRHEPVLMVDLAVPRDIDPGVARFDDVYHYAIDDLQHVVEGNLAKRREAAVRAEVMVSQLAAQIDQKLQVRLMSKDIARFKAHTQAIRDDLLKKAIGQIEQGEDPNEVIEVFSRRLTAKLTHGQFKLLREAASLDDVAIQQQIISALLDDSAFNKK